MEKVVVNDGLEVVRPEGFRIMAICDCPEASCVSLLARS